MTAKEKKSVIKDGLYVLSGHYFAQACNVIRGFYSANTLGPAGYGLWSIIQFYLEFAKFLPLGIDEFSARQLTQNIGKNKYDENLHIIRCYFLFTVIGAMVLLVFGCACLFFWGDKNNPIQYYGIMFVSASLIATLFDRFTYALLTSYGYFQKTALVRQLQAIISLSVVILLIGKYKILAMYWAYFLMLTLSLMIISLLSIKPILRKLRESFLAPRIKNYFRHLIKAAFFLFMLNIVNSCLTNLDRFFVTRHYNAYENGIYFFAGNISMSLNLIVFSFTIVLYQRMNLFFGETHKADETFKYALAACKKVALFFPYVITISFYIIPILFKLFFKPYEPSIFFLRGLSISGYFYSLFLLLTYQLIATRQQRQLLFLSLIFIAFGIFIYEFASRSLPLNKIPYFVITLNGLFMLITLLLARHLANVTYPMTNIFKDVFFLPLVMAAIIAFFELGIYPGNTLKGLTLKSLGVPLSYLLLSLWIRNKWIKPAMSNSL